MSVSSLTGIEPATARETPLLIAPVAKIVDRSFDDMMRGMLKSNHPEELQQPRPKTPAQRQSIGIPLERKPQRERPESARSKAQPPTARSGKQRAATSSNTQESSPAQTRDAAASRDQRKASLASKDAHLQDAGADDQAGRDAQKPVDNSQPAPSGTQDAATQQAGESMEQQGQRQNLENASGEASLDVLAGNLAVAEEEPVVSLDESLLSLSDQAAESGDDVLVAEMAPPAQDEGQTATALDAESSRRVVTGMNVRTETDATAQGQLQAGDMTGAVKAEASPVVPEGQGEAQNATAQSQLQTGDMTAAVKVEASPVLPEGQGEALAGQSADSTQSPAANEMLPQETVPDVPVEEPATLQTGEVAEKLEPALTENDDLPVKNDLSETAPGAKAGEAKPQTAAAQPATTIRNARTEAPLPLDRQVQAMVANVMPVETREARASTPSSGRAPEAASRADSTAQAPADNAESVKENAMVAAADEGGKKSATGEGQQEPGREALLKNAAALNPQVLREPPPSFNAQAAMQRGPATPAQAALDVATALPQPGVMGHLEKVEKLQELVERFDRHVLSMASGKDKTMSITLEPANLGKVVLNCRETGDRMAVEILAENSGVRHLLQQQEQSVRQMLEDNGYKLGDFDVRTQGGEGDASSFTRRQAQERDAEETGNVVWRGEVTGSPDTGKAVNWRPSGSKGIWVVA
ncbi:MAG: flagellar hook-length control protein FliK [Lentisphaerota bacterium]